MCAHAHAVKLLLFHFLPEVHTGSQPAKAKVSRRGQHTKMQKEKKQHLKRGEAAGGSAMSAATPPRPACPCLRRESLQRRDSRHG